jgi:vacuolar-type H+-ATPase subunit D/Vma8
VELVEQELEDKLVEALVEAERACRRFLERALGSKASLISITLRLDVVDGVKVLVVDVEASRRGVSDIEYIVEAAVEEAFRVFEEVSGLRVIRGGRRG